MLTRSQTTPTASSQTNYITRAHNRLQKQDHCNTRYNTRSHTNDNITLNVEIDFDDASREWNRNKRRIGQMYEYICGKTCKTGKPCKRAPVNGDLHCSAHNN